MRLIRCLKKMYYKKRLPEWCELILSTQGKYVRPVIGPLESVEIGHKAAIRGVIEIRDQSSDFSLVKDIVILYDGKPVMRYRDDYKRFNYGSWCGLIRQWALATEKLKDIKVNALFEDLKES